MIVGVLCWYEEPPEALATAVAGFARVCDQIVALDGAYALYPAGRPCSAPGEAEAILAACEAAGVGCIVHRPRELFAGNEVEKRNLSLSLAAAFEPSWVIVFDGDFRVTWCVPEAVRWDLVNTTANVGSYSLRDEHGFGRLAGVYRWTHDLRYVSTHYDVRGTYNGAEVRLREVGSELMLNLEAVHRHDQRSAARKNGMTVYSERRDAYGVETPDRMPELVA